MIVVVGYPSPRKTTTLPGLDRMGIIEAQQPFPISIMQGQTVFNAMRAFLGDHCKFPDFDLYPASLILTEDLTIQIQQVIQSLVFTHDEQHSLILIIG